MVRVMLRHVGCRCMALFATHTVDKMHMPDTHEYQSNGLSALEHMP